jgi:hypothetical protein
MIWIAKWPLVILAQTIETYWDKYWQILILIPTQQFILLAFGRSGFTKSEHKIRPKVRTQILSSSPVQFTKSQPQYYAKNKGNRCGSSRSDVRGDLKMFITLFLATSFHISFYETCDLKRLVTFCHQQSSCFHDFNWSLDKTTGQAPKGQCASVMCRFELSPVLGSWFFQVSRSEGKSIHSTQPTMNWIMIFLTSKIFVTNFKVFSHEGVVAVFIRVLCLILLSDLRLGISWRIHYFNKENREPPARRSAVILSPMSSRLSSLVSLKSPKATNWPWQLVTSNTALLTATLWPTPLLLAFWQCCPLPHTRRHSWCARISHHRLSPTAHNEYYWPSSTPFEVLNQFRFRFRFKYKSLSYHTLSLQLHIWIDSFLIASRQKIGPLAARLVPIHHGRVTNHMLTVPWLIGCCAVLLMNWIKPS